MKERMLLATSRADDLAERAREYESQWTSLLDIAHEGVIVADSSGHVRQINPAGRDLVEIVDADPRVELREWEQTHLLRADGRSLAAGEGPFSRALSGEAFKDLSAIHVRLNGRQRWVAFNASATRDATGAVRLATCVYRDVTSQRNLERTREEYVALISHDLRGPLTNIIGRADLLFSSFARESATSPNDVRSVEAIRRSARHMHAMIQDLVDSTRFEVGAFALRLDECDVAALVNESIAGMLSMEEQARIQVMIEGAVPNVSLDRDRISRVIHNLLANALKYSPSQSTVYLTILATQQHLVFSVRDSGTGIPPSDRGRLFEKYFRAEASGSIDGLGLGLYIARIIVEASGGRIWVESQIGTGSTFSFQLPLS